MKNYSKKQFLQEVTDEIENIKLYATDKEKQKLDFDTFDPDYLTSSIYGQLTGHCESDRAIKLITKCCKRYYHSLLEGFIRLKNANNKNIISYIKGEKEKLILEKK